MPTSTFDTLAAVRTMEVAGVPRPQAEAIASALQGATEGQIGELATRTELQSTKAELLTAKTELRAAIDGLRVDLYRALWVQGAGIVATVGGMVAIVGTLVALR